MYKGYLKGEGKKAAKSFKDDPDKLLSYNTARKQDSYVGILADEFIMIDIDTQKETDLFMTIMDDLDLKCSVLQTDQGIHVYFKGYELTANKVDWYSPIGIKVTAKLGIKNTVDPLKINGKVRKWLRKSKNHDPFPKWLHPLDRSKNHISQIDTGSRNQELFNYILKLQSVGMSKKEIRETIKIINDFVLETPLPKKEIDTILRDESFLKQSFFKDKTFLHDSFARFLIREHHIIKIVGVMHIYKDGIYSDDQLDIERAMIKHIPTLTQTRRKEVLTYLQLESPDKHLSSVKYVALTNGILNTDTWDMELYTPDIILKNKINITYHPDAYHDITDQTLDKMTCYDKELRLVLEEIFAYILLRRNEYRKSFILTGDGKNGKSTYLKMIRAFVGNHNTASLDLKELGQRFKTAELFGKLVNIGDDISNEFIKNNSEFKKLTTGETLSVERKGRDPFDFQNYAKLIFSANDMPRINDHSTGLISRLMIVPFNAIFDKTSDDYDPFIHDKLISQEAMEYILTLAVEGLKRLLKNKGFSNSKIVEAESEKYKVENNPLLSFISEERKIENELTSDIYQQYQTWCAENSYNAVSQVTFSRHVCKHLKLKTKLQRIDHKPKRIFVHDI